MNYTENLMKNHTVLHNSSLNIEQDVSHSVDHTIWKKLDYVTYTKIAFSSVLIVGGLLANISIIVTVILKGSKRNISNIYATNLAVADSLVILFCMVPLGLSAILEDAFLVSEFMCKYAPFIQMTCLAGSVFTLSALSYARFKAVICPFYAKFKPHNTTLSVLKIWGAATILALPLLIVKKQSYSENFWERKCVEEWPFQKVLDNTPGKCTWNDPLHFAYYLQVSLLLFFLPFTVMTGAYSRILYKLWTETMLGLKKIVRSDSYLETRNRWTKTIILMIMTFVLTWTSFQIMILRSAYECMTGILTTKCSDCQWFIYFTAYSNSFYNPFFYMCFNKAIREDVIYLWRRGYIKDPPPQEEALALGNGSNPKSTSTCFRDILNRIKKSLSSDASNENDSRPRNENNDSNTMIQDKEVEKAPENI